MQFVKYAYSLSCRDLNEKMVTTLMSVGSVCSRSIKHNDWKHWETASLFKNTHISAFKAH